MQMIEEMRKPRERLGEAGFTLPELLVSIVVSSLIMLALYCTFHVQNRTHTAQEDIADMQLNVRAAMAVMSE